MVAIVTRPVDRAEIVVAGELAAGIAKGNEELVADSIGDMVVVLTILAEQSGLRIENCIKLAYLEIKDRKGRMHDGVFIKSEDLNVDKT